MQVHLKDPTQNIVRVIWQNAITMLRVALCATQFEDVDAGPHTEYWS